MNNLIEPIIDNSEEIFIEMNKWDFENYLSIMGKYLESKMAGDNLMLTRVLENGRVEISGEGQYITVEKDLFDSSMIEFDEIINSQKEIIE